VGLRVWPGRCGAWVEAVGFQAVFGNRRQIRKVEDKHDIARAGARQRLPSSLQSPEGAFSYPEPHQACCVGITHLGNIHMRGRLHRKQNRLGNILGLQELHLRLQVFHLLAHRRVGDLVIKLGLDRTRLHGGHADRGLLDKAALPSVMSKKNGKKAGFCNGCSVRQRASRASYGIKNLPHGGEP